MTHSLWSLVPIVLVFLVIWWMLRDPKKGKKGERKSRVREEAAAAAWGALGMWAWTKFGKRMLDRTPLVWKVIGGLFLAGVLALVFRAPELAWPVFVGTLGLVGYALLHRKGERVPKPEQIVKNWSQTVLDNDTLKVLRGSTAKVTAQDEHGFTVEVTLAGGRTAKDVQGIESNLESVFHADRGTLTVLPARAAHQVLLRFMTKDPLEKSVPWPGPEARSIKDPIPLGVDEHGQPVSVNLLGQHALVAGQTGAGKSTVGEVLLRSLLAMDDVRVWGVDPKMVEQARFRKELARFATEPDEIVQLLAAAREEIRERRRVMADNGLTTWPTSPERPAIVVLVDELAEVPDDGKLIIDSIVRLGRAMRVQVVACTQHPSVKTFGELGGSLRSQLSLTIGLRCTSGEARMIFGDQAQQEGWGLLMGPPGALMLRDADHREPVRIRAYWPGGAPRLTVVKDEAQTA